MKRTPPVTEPRPPLMAREIAPPLANPVDITNLRGGGGWTAGDWFAHRKKAQRQRRAITD